MKNVHDIEIEIKGKEWEQILVEKDPSLARYFGISEPKPKKSDSSKKPAEVEDGGQK